MFPFTVILSAEAVTVCGATQPSHITGFAPAPAFTVPEVLPVNDVLQRMTVGTLLQCFSRVAAHSPSAASPAADAAEKAYGVLLSAHIRVRSLARRDSFLGASTRHCGVSAHVSIQTEAPGTSAGRVWVKEYSGDAETQLSAPSSPIYKTLKLTVPPYSRFLSDTNFESGRALALTLNDLSGAIA